MEMRFILRSWDFVQQRLDFVIRGTHRDDSGTFLMLDALIQDCSFLLSFVFSVHFCTTFLVFNTAPF